MLTEDRSLAMCHDDGVSSARFVCGWTGASQEQGVDFGLAHESSSVEHVRPIADVSARSPKSELIALAEALGLDSSRGHLAIRLTDGHDGRAIRRSLMGTTPRRDASSLTTHRGVAT